MALDKAKVQRAREESRQRQREVRNEFDDSDDHAYRVTLDHSWHFYEGEITAYTAILEGTHNEEAGDPLLEGEKYYAKITRGRKSHSKRTRKS